MVTILIRSSPLACWLRGPLILIMEDEIEMHLVEHTSHLSAREWFQSSSPGYLYGVANREISPSLSASSAWQKRAKLHNNKFPKTQHSIRHNPDLVHTQNFTEVSSHHIPTQPKNPRTQNSNDGQTDERTNETERTAMHEHVKTFL